MAQHDFSGQVAVITGGAKGIGLAIAERMIREGASVCLWDMDGDRLDQVKSQFEEGRVLAQVVDVTNATSVDEAAAAAEREFGRIDILVCSAGIAGAAKKSWEYSPDEWRQVIDIDLNGVYLSCMAALPYMRRRDYGRIVNIASIAGKEGNPNAAAYSAAKAGVIGLTKSLGKELADTGIRVNCITPAAIRTEIFDQISQEHIDFMLSKIPLARFGLVEEMASLVAWLSSEECSFSTGAVFDVSGGRATY